MSKELTKIPEWARVKAEEVRTWFIQPEAGKFAVDGFNAGVRCVLDRLEKTREKDRDASNDPGMDLINEGRESVRKEVLDDQP